MPTSETAPPTIDPRVFPINGIEAQLGFLEGEILTIADASFSNREQCKAVKDMIRLSFRNRLRWMDQLASKPGECSQNPFLNGPAASSC